MPRNSDFYSFDRVQKITGLSTRTLRTNLATLPRYLTRQIQCGSAGRPALEYHFAALPQLTVHHEADKADVAVEAGTRKNPVSKDNLIVAQLRLSAIKEYETRCETMTRELALFHTANEWSQSNREVATTVKRRLPKNWTRHERAQVSLGEFSPRTLRAWASSIYRNSKRLPDHLALVELVPKRKGKCGRISKRDERCNDDRVPEDLFQFVYALSASAARSDVTKAVDAAKAHWPGDFPNISIATWRRWVRDFDPRKAGKDLFHSVAKHRANHTPDIEVDWTQLAFNDRWEIDDVQMDWYAYSSERDKLIRPYAYAIIRAATRQWVGLVTSETSITTEQISTLVGFSMASPAGGIPGMIKFENGTTPCTPDLEALLNSLGVKISRIEMERGKAHPDFMEDRAKGNPRGHGIIEANNRRLHNEGWAMPTQVGPEERHTAPARLEKIKAYAAKLAKEGKFLEIPQANEWLSLTRAMCDSANNRPHSGLPVIIDPQSGAQRHMTPNEKAMSMQDQAVTVMPQTYLPLFTTKGQNVKVTQNGIRINNISYGRFDQELLALDRCTAHVCEAHPKVAFVEELGRCIERYDKEDVDASAQFEKKRHIEKLHRNKYEEAMSKAIELGGVVMIERTAVTDNPTPDREATTVDVPELTDRVTRIQESRARFKKEEQDFEDSFKPGSSRIAKPVKRRTSLLETAGRLSISTNVNSTVEG